MPRAAAKVSGRAPTTTRPRDLSAGPSLEPLKPGPKGDPVPADQDKLIQRGTLMAIVYAEVGSYAAVAKMFGVQPATLRWWVHETRKRNQKELQKITDRLRGDVAQLAVDRVQEGLVEGDTEFAATLGAKILHGLGELKSHSAVKTDLPAGGMTLTLVVERKDPSQATADVVEGSVLGIGRSLDAPQTAAEAE